jgi:hypothetical protein
LELGRGLTFEDDDDAIGVGGNPLGTSGTWKRQPVPFRATAIDIDASGEVIIEAGTRFEMSGGSINVFKTTLIVNGTKADPVVFTSGQPNPAAADWGCINVYQAGAPAFEYAIFEYAGNGSGCTKRTALYASPSKLSNCTFRDIGGVGVFSGSCPTEDWCTDNTFESLSGEDYSCNGKAKTCP